MRSALFLPLFDDLSEPRVAVEIAVAAEEAGWDGVFVWDHLLWDAPVDRVADPWVVMSAIASATERVLIGPMVTPVPRRRPQKLVRETVTLDRLSNGRLIFGVGIGGDRGGEFSRFDEELDRRARADLLDNGLDKIARWWAGDEVNGVTLHPLPVQQPRIPVWVGSRFPNRRPIRRAAQWDGWFPVEVPSPDALIRDDRVRTGTSARERAALGGRRTRASGCGSTTVGGGGRVVVAHTFRTVRSVGATRTRRRTRRPAPVTVEHVALVGTTASGKSSLAMAIGRAHRDIEIVSVDSMQVYRGMDVGTAKATAAEQADVPHHLIDLSDPGDEFTVARFQRAFGDALAAIEHRGHRALLVGGTGLYLRAVVDGLAIPAQYPETRREFEGAATAQLHTKLAELDPIAAARMEPSNRRRIVRALEVTVGSGRPFSSYGPGLEAYRPTRFRLVGVALPPGMVNVRIEERYRQQLDGGFVDEVRRLAARPTGLSRTASQALGYRELLAHLRGELAVDAALEEATRRTRHFARRQRAWFRRDPRIEWLDGGERPGRGIAVVGTHRVRADLTLACN